MRALTTVIATLTLATAINATKARAETPKIVSAWLTYITSGHKGEVQHLITARYDAPEMALATAACRFSAVKFLEELSKEPTLKLVVDPSCATEKPPWWID